MHSAYVLGQAVTSACRAERQVKCSAILKEGTTLGAGVDKGLWHGRFPLWWTDLQQWILAAKVQAMAKASSGMGMSLYCMQACSGVQAS